MVACFFRLESVTFVMDAKGKREKGGGGGGLAATEQEKEAKRKHCGDVDHGHQYLQEMSGNRKSSPPYFHSRRLLPMHSEGATRSLQRGCPFFFSFFFWPKRERSRRTRRDKVTHNGKRGDGTHSQRERVFRTTNGPLAHDDVPCATLEETRTKAYCVNRGLVR